MTTRNPYAFVLDVWFHTPAFWAVVVVATIAVTFESWPRIRRKLTHR